MHISPTLSVSPAGCRVPSCLRGWRERGRLLLHLPLLRWRNSMLTKNTTLTITIISRLTTVRTYLEMGNIFSMEMENSYLHFRFISWNFPVASHSATCSLCISRILYVVLLRWIHSVRSFKYASYQHISVSVPPDPQKGSQSSDTALWLCLSIFRTETVVGAEWGKPHAGRLFPAPN